METTATSPVVRAGWAGVVAGPLLALSVGIELVSDVQRPDGTVTAPALFTILMVLWALGTVCIAATVLGLRRLHTDAGRPLPRVGRAGVRFMLAGCLLLLAFPVLAGSRRRVSGRPADIVFLPFGIGFLCLIAGSGMLGRGVRRADALPLAAVPLWLGALRRSWPSPFPPTRGTTWRSSRSTRPGRHSG